METKSDFELMRNAPRRDKVIIFFAFVGISVIPILMCVGKIT